ncbi:NAD(P)H nitroreductase [Mycobacterium sp. 852013-51886_SCH5428379]|uniref:Acg family FMN-binding oxidoreductase n=1 Tax=Mycobacterium sp. 852013-51886_SCH5428379 TaxID=1834111 RepID=UPI0007FC9078|nr:NAD(P)H nitroreductase [Mycobacterium sp. 852013-51886_SCH5428379]OBB59970.1 NAD(P)H nitroreductase [Mycobacterium sp. 852013-51886_SCH5428379]
MISMPPLDTIENAVALACRAPSVHNSQPWRWIADGSALHLFLDADRVVTTDRSGREALLSCGAALDHLRVAMAASGWIADVDRYPDTADRRHIAAITFSPMPEVTDGHRARAEAIRRRHTDRLPFEAPPEWASLEALLRGAVDESVAIVDVVRDDVRPQLAEASELNEALRYCDSEYHAELTWWSKLFAVSDGIPGDALVSAAERDRVDIGRAFPDNRRLTERRRSIPQDRSKILVVSAHDTTGSGVLGCGETLSQVLLEATAAGLATCTLSHLTELTTVAQLLSSLIGRDHPQLVIRVGLAPSLEDAPLPTPRRPVGEVLEVRA